MTIFWLHPLAWLGLAAVAIPIAVHLLAHRRAERVVFPTLRFLPPTRLAAIRRRALEDLVLLAVRAAVVVAAVAAFVGPLLVTPARRAAWNARIVSETVASVPLSQGIHRALARLESAPPARRELVIAAPLTIGSLTTADLAVVPADVGIRFVRTGDLPSARTIDAPPLVGTGGEVRRTVTLTGAETGVREELGNGRVAWPIEVIAPPSLEATAAAARAAVLSVRVAVAPADHRARLVLLDEGTGRPPSGGPTAPDASAEPSAIRAAWIADAVARIARDPALHDEASRLPNGLGDRRFTQAPWHAIARARDGRPVAAAAAAGDQLLVAAAANEGDLLVPTLVRAIAANLASPPNLGDAEILAIPDSQLRAWSRPPGPPPLPRPETVERDDRRWLWGAALVLLAVEAWLRRSKAEPQQMAGETQARVA